MSDTLLTMTSGDLGSQSNPLTQKEIESTTSFKEWEALKKEEAKNYVYNAFGLSVLIEDLIILRDDAGWPDPMGKAGSHKIIVSNQKYKDSEDNTLGNYIVWRKLPAPAPVTETPIVP